MQLQGLDTLAHSLQAFFGIFTNFNEWSWNSLPKAYLVSVDKGAISTYFTEMEDASAHGDTMPGGNESWILTFNLKRALMTRSLLKRR